MVIKVIHVLLISTFCLMHLANGFRYVDVSEEQNMNISEIIRSRGYPVEEHNVLTQDGYILGVQRIPHGRNETKPLGISNRPVVFLQHGLLCTSTNWVTNMPHQSLAFILADAGFDVWLGNIRGNTYSRRHVGQSVDDEGFWDFSWDEMAKYDLPSMINYALDKSRRKQLFYVGHSQGTAIGFAGFSEDPELAAKVKLFVALAPVARIDRCRSPIRFAAYFSKGFEVFLDIFGVKEFLPNSKLTRFLAEKVCPLDQPACRNLMFVLMGPDTRNLNQSRIPIYLSHNPAGTSVRNMLHYAQGYMSRKFQAYDFGYFKNLIRYGSFSPKIYDVKKMATPVWAVSGGRDWLADPKDVRWILQQVKHLVRHNALPDYNHLDFIWGIDAHTRVYKPIVEAFKKYDLRT